MALSALFLGSILLGIVAVLIWYILQVVAYWVIFKKTGEAGWKSIIPFYNTYTQYKMTWNPNMFWISTGLTIVSGLLFGIDSSLITVLRSLCLVAGSIINVLASFKLAAAFGKGVLFGIGLWLFGPVFYLILAFGSAQYQGPQY